MAITEGIISYKIKEKLKSIDVDHEKLSDKIKEYLYNIETIISPKAIEQDKALKILKEPSFSIKSIAEQLGISRTTLYNNNILKRYIEYSAEIFAESSPYAICENLRVSKSELEKQIDGFLDRDIETEILKQEIFVLNKKLIEKEKEIQDIRKRKREVDAENRALKDKNKQITRAIEDAADIEQLRKNLIDKAYTKKISDSKIISI